MPRDLRSRPRPSLLIPEVSLEDSGRRGAMEEEEDEEEEERQRASVIPAA